MHIRKVQAEDISDLDNLFRVCMTDLVMRENKEKSLIEEEVDQLNRIVQESLFDSKTALFVAELDRQIVGTIALKNPNLTISDNILTEPDVFEVGSVYIRLAYQRQGIGKLLFQYIKKALLRLGQTKYYLDAGFSTSQQYWRQLLGKPSYILKNYWGEREDHHIWINNV
ncbi:GNAT family N-acetyltransferase [Siminovitchia acidinfaciens]|nr:GNAT family N-acetyltransferase [Siminovitchia acidinfaciens]